jgi:hypothetical protein
MTRSLRIWTMIHKIDKCLLNAQQDRRIDKRVYQARFYASAVILRRKLREVERELEQRRAA